MAWQRTIAVLGGWCTERPQDELSCDQFVTATSDGSDVDRAVKHEQRGAFVAADASEVVRLIGQRGAISRVTHDCDARADRRQAQQRRVLRPRAQRVGRGGAAAYGPRLGCHRCHPMTIDLGSGQLAR